MKQSPVRFEEAWAEYKRAWAKSIAPNATHRDVDPDAKRRALRAFKAGWRAAHRAAEIEADNSMPYAMGGAPSP